MIRDFNLSIYSIIFSADGGVAACVDVLHITHAAISMVKEFNF